MSGGKAKPAIYLLGSAGVYGWEFANWKKIQSNGKGIGIHHNEGSWPDDFLNAAGGPWQIPNYAETPKLTFDPKRSVKDIYAVEYFYFISDKMKILLEETAPGSCDYLLCETEFIDGTPGPRIWQCSVLDSYNKAVDIEKSEIIRLRRDGSYLISGGANWQFLPAVLRGAQLFRLVEFPSGTLCDQSFKSLCRSRGIKGTSFRQVGFLTV